LAWTSLLRAALRVVAATRTTSAHFSPIMMGGALGAFAHQRRHDGGVCDAQALMMMLDRPAEAMALVDRARTL